MTMFLDLDSIDSVTGEVQYKGVTYQIKPITISQLVNISLIDESKEVTEDDMESMISLIHEIVGMERALIMEMTMDQLSALMKMVSSLGEEESKNDAAPELTGAA